MRNSPRLLVITPSLGVSPWLGDVVGDVSILSQSLPIEHVVVAPSSERARLRASWPRVRVVDEPSNGGLYPAINAGIHASDDWDWFTYINDDDRLHPELVHEIDELERGGIFYGDVRYIDRTGKAVAMMPVCRRPGDVPALLARGVAPFTQQGTMVHRSVLDAVGGFNEELTLAGDFEFWVRAAQAGVPFHYRPKTVASFRIHSEQLSADPAAVELELRAILGRTPLSVNRMGSSLALLRFRASNACRILARLQRSGRLTSRNLYARRRER